MTFIVHLPREEDEPEKDWLIEWLTKRNDNNFVTNILTTGPRGSGKSRGSAALIEHLDPTFTPSLKNHPVYTHDPNTAKYCHLSISPLPLLEALNEDLLPQRSWWLIDEPRDLKNIDWWTEVAKTLNNVLTQYRETLVNVAICAIVKRKILGDLRELIDIWIRLKKRGVGVVWQMENIINRKSTQRLELRVPKGVGPIKDWPMPSADFEHLYKPIRDYGFKETLANSIKTLKDKGYIG